MQKVIRTTKYSEKIAVQKLLQKKKLSLGRLAAQLLLLIWENRRDIPLDVMFLHIAAIAEEVHVVYLLLVVRFKFLPFCNKLSLQLFFLR